MKDKLITIPIEDVDEEVYEEIIKDLKESEINFKVWELKE